MTRQNGSTPYTLPVKPRLPLKRKPVTSPSRFAQKEGAELYKFHPRKKQEQLATRQDERRYNVHALPVSVAMKWAMNDACERSGQQKCKQHDWYSQYHTRTKQNRSINQQVTYQAFYGNQYSKKTSHRHTSIHYTNVWEKKSGGKGKHQLRIHALSHKHTRLA